MGLALLLLPSPLEDLLRSALGLKWMPEGSSFWKSLGEDVSVEG